MPARPYSFHDPERCHVCKAAVGEPHAGHCSVSPGVMVATKPPEPKFDLPCCVLCGKPPLGSSDQVRCDNFKCPLDSVWIPLDEWRKLHAPNRLTLKYRRADTGMGDRWWPVTLNNDRTMALFTHRADAATCAERADHRSVLDPIDVEVTVKP